MAVAVVLEDRLSVGRSFGSPVALLAAADLDIVDTAPADEIA